MLLLAFWPTNWILELWGKLAQCGWELTELGQHQQQPFLPTFHPSNTHQISSQNGWSICYRLRQRLSNNGSRGVITKWMSAVTSRQISLYNAVCSGVLLFKVKLVTKGFFVGFFVALWNWLLSLETLQIKITCDMCFPSAAIQKSNLDIRVTTATTGKVFGVTQASIHVALRSNTYGVVAGAAWGATL